LATRIQHRRASREDWNTINPVLADGEIGVSFYIENSELRSEIRVGDGESTWTQLEAISGPEGPIGPTGPVGATGPAVTGPTGPAGTNIDVTGPTAPADPSNGDFWFDPTDGRLYMYYSDIDSSQWVQVNIIPPF
jgi:hypothetical protein